MNRTRDIAELLAPLVRSERALVDIALHPALVFKFAVPHVLLTRLGYPDARVDALLRSCASSQASNGHDRPGVALVERGGYRPYGTAANSPPSRKPSRAALF
jgi:hypothetical protein